MEEKETDKDPAANITTENGESTEKDEDVCPALPARLPR